MLVIALGLGLSLIWTWTFVFPLDAIFGGDDLLMIWNLWNVNDSLTHGHNPFFAPHVYYPLGTFLARHTYSPGFWPVAWLLEFVSGHSPLYAVMAYHVCVWLSYGLALAFAYLFLRRLGFGRFAAAVPALQYALSVFARGHFPHLQHISFLFLLPLASLAVLAFVRDPRAGRLASLAFVLAVTVYFSEMSVFLWIGLALLVVFAAVLPATRPTLRKVLTTCPRWALVTAALVFLLTLAPFLQAWIAQPGNAPNPRQTVAGSGNLVGFFLPHSLVTSLYGRSFDAWSAPTGGRQGLPRGMGGDELFLGFPLLTFAAAGFVRRPQGFLVIVATLTAVFAVLTLGPHLMAGGWEADIPLPYAALLKIPPFNMGRSPARNIVFVLWGCAIGAAYGLEAFESRLHHVRRSVSILCRTAVIVWAGLEAYAPWVHAKSYVVPAQLSKLPPGPVVNLPLSVFDGFGILLQTIHHQPIVTGFVSRRTPEQAAYIRDLDRLLATNPPAFVAKMEGIGVRSVIVGTGASPQEEQALRVSGRLVIIDARPAAGAEELPPDRLLRQER